MSKLANKRVDHLVTQSLKSNIAEQTYNKYTYSIQYNPHFKNHCTIL